MNSLFTKPLQRLRVSDGMLINSDRWQLAHDYHSQRHNLLYQSLFQAGIVTGLAVSPIAPPQNVPAKYRDGRWLLIHPGIAIDASGNFIIVPEPMEFRLASQPLEGEQITVYLVLSFVDPATLRGNGSDILTETFRINEKSSPPSELEIELCRLTLSAGTITVSAPPMIFQPQVNQLDLRWRPSASLRPTFGVKVGTEQTEQWQGLLRAMPSLAPQMQIQVQALSSVPNLDDCDLIFLPDATFRTFAEEQVYAYQEYLSHGGVVLVQIGLRGTRLAEMMAVAQELETAVHRLGRAEEVSAVVRELETELGEVQSAMQDAIAQCLRVYGELANRLGVTLQPFRELPADHPMRSQPFLFSALPVIAGYPLQMWVGGGLIVAVGDLADTWTLIPPVALPRETLRTAHEMAVNLLSFAQMHHQLHRMMRTTPEAAVPSQRQITTMLSS